MKNLKAGILSLLMVPLFAHAEASKFQKISAAEKLKTMSLGSESGGGGSATDRSPLSINEIKELIGNIHESSRPNFNFLFNMLDTRNAGVQTVVMRIQKVTQQDPQFFNKLQLSLSEGSCSYKDGRTSMATYSAGVICFDVHSVASLGYGRDEAPAKLAALYAHEVGHAAGFTDSASDEHLLGEFQKQVEATLAQWKYHPRWVPSTLLVTFGLAPTFADMSNATRDKRSLVWLCVKLQKLLQETGDIPVRNRQESHGLSLMTSEQESFLDLLVWEGDFISSINCEGSEDSYKPLVDYNVLRDDRRQLIPLNEALQIARQHEGFCDGYSQKVCTMANEIKIRTKPQSVDQLRITLENWAKRTYKYLRQFDQKELQSQ